MFLCCMSWVHFLYGVFVVVVKINLRIIFARKVHEIVGRVPAVDVDDGFVIGDQTTISFSFEKIG